MSISNVDSYHSLLSHEPKSQQRQHRVGEDVRLTVLQRLDDLRYQVGFADGWRVVYSKVALPVGAAIRATVTAVGERLELKYEGADVVATAMAEHEATGEDALAEHEQRFNVRLPELDRETLRRAVHETDDTDTMLMSGLFLGKLAQPIDAPKLQAVYDSLRWPEIGPARSLGASRSMPGDQQIEQLATAMDQALREAPTNVSFDAATAQETPNTSCDDEPDRERRQLAWTLLNDQDGGSVEYRYGVLPLIIADQLFELDLVYFRDRNAGADPLARSKRMVMTLNAPTLGRVEVVAQAIGERVAVTINTESDASKQILSAEQHRVRELLERMGWGVDGIRYEADQIDRRAATHVIEHVLNGDSLSRWV
jgi:uncharacterized OsmC-like protein